MFVFLFNLRSAYIILQKRIKYGELEPLLPVIIELFNIGLQTDSMAEGHGLNDVFANLQSLQSPRNMSYVYVL